MSRDTQAKRREQLEAFLSRSSTHAQDDASLCRFLEYDQERASSSSVVPLDELQERLHLVKQVQNRVFGKLRGPPTADKIERRQFTALQLSVIMMMPLEKLRETRTTLADFHDFEKVIKIFLQQALPDQVGTTASSRLRTRSQTKSSHVLRQSRKRKRSMLESDDDYDAAEAASVQRSTTEAKKCLERDSYACKIKLTSSPMKCHFVPFAVNATTASLKLLRDVIPAYRSLFLNEDSGMPDLIIDSLGCSDKSWNMVCLNSQLHTWWGKCFFGIKCVGICAQEDLTNSKVFLEFHWMSRRSRQDPARKVSIGTAAAGDTSSEHQHAQESEATQFVRGPGIYYGDITEANPDQLDKGFVMDFVGPSGRPLLSGHRFHIIMTAKDAPKMKAMVDFQWACVNIANMSGAASWPAFTGDDDDDDDDADARVSSWVEETSLASPVETYSMLGLSGDLYGGEGNADTG